MHQICSPRHPKIVESSGGSIASSTWTVSPNGLGVCCQCTPELRDRAVTCAELRNRGCATGLIRNQCGPLLAAETGRQYSGRPFCGAVDETAAATASQFSPATGWPFSECARRGTGGRCSE